MEAGKLISELTKKLEVLEKENRLLKKTIRLLKEQLSQYETPKNSQNSSIPPSKDENRIIRKSLRGKSRRHTGGQYGHVGKTLLMFENPDEIVKHSSCHCDICGEPLHHCPTKLIAKRQVVDIPIIKQKVIEHQVYQTICSCGHTITSEFPPEVKAPVSYGTNIQSLITYLHTRQYLPFQRMQELLNDVFQIPISEGGIYYLLDKMARKAEPIYQSIKQKLAVSKEFVGSDETGVKVKGKKYWGWTWQNKELTYITITNNRGNKAVSENFKNGFSEAVLIHDCWRSQLHTPAKAHQICLAHLLRDLEYLTERYHNQWSKTCKKVFLDAIRLKKGKKFNLIAPSDILEMEKRLDRLLQVTLNAKHKELISFQKRLIKYRDHLFPFLYYEEVPPDNNSSERAIRNIKVKQKISTQFKSERGADIFAILRSVVDTTLKNGKNVLNTLHHIPAL
ncbi:MAG: IS66 family transposase [Bacteroidales bacterium]